MDNRDYMQAFGEWLCSIAPNSIVKSLMHNSVGCMCERDYVLVTNLCNGFAYMPEITMTVIDGAKERYKEANNSLLEISPLSDNEKKVISSQIDHNAEMLKQQWINKLRNKGIFITN